MHHTSTPLLPPFLSFFSNFELLLWLLRLPLLESQMLASSSLNLTTARVRQPSTSPSRQAVQPGYNLCPAVPPPPHHSNALDLVCVCHEAPPTLEKGEDCSDPSARRSPPYPPLRPYGDSVDDELAGQKMRVHHAPVVVVAAYTVHLLARPLVSFGRSARPGLESNGGGGGHNALDRMDWLGRV